MNDLMNIQRHDGQLVVSSKIIAKELGKEHKHILSKCREILGGSEYCLSSYMNSQNKEQPEFLLTKDGFILLCMNYQGYNDFKRIYIKNFNKMEKQLEHQFKIPTTYKEALLELVKIEEEKEKILLENTENKPKVKYYNNVLDSTNLLTTSEVALELGMTSNKLNKLVFSLSEELKIRRSTTSMGLFLTKDIMD